MGADAAQRPPAGRGWFALPLFVRIAIGLVVGLVFGGILHGRYHGPSDTAGAVKFSHTAYGLNATADLILRFLNAVAYPLILLAILRAIMTTEVKGAGRLIYLLTLNTVVAIVVGLAVANVVHPGTHANPPPPDPTATHKEVDPLGDLLADMPNSLVQPLAANNSIGVIAIALTFGAAGRRLPGDARAVVLRGIGALFEWVVIVLHWILELVPLAVAARVAFELQTKGFRPFVALAWFVLSVIAALLIQSGYYLLRVAWRSWVTPAGLLRGTRDALVMAFSTGSSTATMPLTYECLTNRVGLKPESASLGVLVGGNLNHDGTALYEAMSALFVAQAIGMHLTIPQQLLTIVTSMIAGAGAAGIPEAGLVTMTMVFSAVGIDPSYRAMVIPVDWFLDRCRTAINVMGDASVACLLDGKRRADEAVTPPSRLEVVPITADDGGRAT